MDCLTSKDNVLNHLAIILDGNGRWAKKQGLSRTNGHEQGALAVREIAAHISKIDINFLTLYAFSTENWNRPKSEIVFIEKLIERFLKSEMKNLLQNNIRFRHIGDIEPFSSSLKETVVKSEEHSKKCTGLTQTLALNYGAKNEIVRAVKKIADEKKEINEKTISSALDTHFSGDVDLLIRTGGDCRLSNFLLWQCAYAEFCFTPTLWPDFTPKELDKIIEKYKKVHRRFGGL